VGWVKLETFWFVLQLLVRSQMSIEEGGLARNAVYICTEGEPPTPRLMQIADAHMSELPDAFERGHPLDHIYVEKVFSPLISLLFCDHECSTCVGSNVHSPEKTCSWHVFKSCCK